MTKQTRQQLLKIIKTKSCRHISCHECIETCPMSDVCQVEDDSFDGTCSGTLKGYIIKEAVKKLVSADCTAATLSNVMKSLV